MKILKKITAAGLALSLAASGISAGAYTETLYLCGDVNCNNVLDITDFIKIKSIITGNYSPEYAEMKLSDMNCDGRTDSADLILFQRHMFGELKQEDYLRIEYPEEPKDTSTEKKLIPSPVANANASTQSTGTAGSLNIFVEFNNSSFRDDKLSESQLWEEMFGNGATKYPFESLNAYLERSSYGNFTITGDCIYYHAKGNIEDYSSQPSDREKLITEIMKSVDSEYDFSDYDMDNDGDIDILTITPALDKASESIKDFWYGSTCTWYYTEFTADGVHIDKYIQNDVMPYTEDMYYFKQTYLHELGHSMGLSDYYKYASEDYEGFKGDAGFCRMDDSIGDYNSFSKLMLGWLGTDEVQIYDRKAGGEQTFELKDSSLSGSCLILPPDNWDGTYTSEYFLIEYVSSEMNNADIKNFYGSWWSKDKCTGFRIFHADAELYTDYWNRTDFRYDNYSEKYNGDDRQRILRLVNTEKTGFFKKGNSCSNLMLYDKNGYETVNSGYQVEFTEETEGKYTIKVSLKQ